VPNQAQIDEKKAEKEKWLRIAATLRDMTRSEAWDVFQEQVSLLENQSIQSLISCEANQHDYHKGFIEGMRTVYNLPFRIVDRVANS
jgi:hypothetical protein